MNYIGISSQIYSWTLMYRAVDLNFKLSMFTVYLDLRERDTKGIRWSKIEICCCGGTLVHVFLTHLFYFPIARSRSKAFIRIPIFWGTHFIPVLHSIFFFFIKLYIIINTFDFLVRFEIFSEVQSFRLTIRSPFDLKLSYFFIVNLQKYIT